jgi:HK97 family phage prohead protease
MPKPQDGESRDDFIERCMGDQEAVDDFPDHSQRFAVCNSLWNQRMNDRTALLESVKQRNSRSGIVTADRYFREVEGCFDGGFCPVKHVGADDSSEWTRALKDAEQTLTFRNKKMRVVKTSLKPGPSEALRFDAIITTPHRDRDGDILKSDGAILDEDMPLLSQHIAMNPLGGMVKVLRKNSRGVRARFSIADTEFGRDHATLIKANALRISHGFDPKEWEPMEDEDGWLFKVFEIFETSLVSIPSNVQARVLEIGEKAWESDFMKSWAGRIKSEDDTETNACGCETTESTTDTVTISPIEVPVKMIITTEEQIATVADAEEAPADSPVEDVPERSFADIEREYIAGLAKEDTDALRKAHRRLSLMLRAAEQQEEAKALDTLLSCD